MKRLIFWLLLLCSVFLFSFNGFAAVIKGDLDGSGRITLADAISGLQFLTRGQPTTSVLKEADVDGDKRIGFSEIIYVLQVVSYLRLGAQAPEAPAGLTATPGVGRVTASWNPVPDTISYNLYRATASGTRTAGTKIASVPTPYADLGLSYTNTYYYVVTAENAAGESTVSSEASASPLAPPAAPTGVMAASGIGQVTISWNPVTNAISYNLYRSTTSGTGTSGTKVASVNSPYTDPGLSYTNTYYYVLTAVNAAGEGAVSTEVSVSPIAPPAAPPGVTATPGNAQATITWNTVSGATSYNVYRSTVSGAGKTGTKLANKTSPFINTGLTNGTNYYYVVTAVNAVGEGAVSSEISATPVAPPPAPTGVAVSPGDTRATITWNAVSGATSYNVYRSTTSGAGKSGTKLANKTSPYIDTGLTNGTTYYYVVAAANAGGESTASSQVSTSPIAPPVTPTGLTATPGNAQATIAWNPVSGATSYNVYRSTTSGAGKAGTKLTNITSPYTNTGLTNGTTYYYVVAAVNAGGEGTVSSEVSATPVAPPVAPSGVTATFGNAQATITWNSVSGATSYNVYRSTTSGTGKSGTKLTNKTSPYIDTGLTNGTTYYYVVTAVNAGGEGAVSSEVSVVPISTPAAPAGVTATAGNAQVTIAWNPVSGATSYNVYRSTTSGAGKTGTKLANMTSPYINTGLANGTTYYYVVTAVNAVGEGAVSSEVSALPVGLPGVPTGVTASAGNAQATIAWNPVSGAASYNVYRSTTSGAGKTGTKLANKTSPYIDAGLTNGTTYYYVVSAVNAGGESGVSAEASVQPLLLPPTGVAVSLQGWQVLMSWYAVSGATSYNLYRSTTSGAGKTGTKITGATSPYIDAGVISGKTYYYTVVAVNGGLEGNISQEISITVNLQLSYNRMTVSNDWGDNGSLDEKTYWYFNAAGQVVRIDHDFDNNGQIDDTEYYHYDAAGRLVSFDGDGSTYYYDSTDRVSRIEYTVDEGKAYYYYDASGWLIRIEKDTDNDGQVDFIEKRYYNASGRLDRAECDDDNDGQIDYIESYQYAQSGRDLFKPWDYKHDARWDKKYINTYDTQGKVVRVDHDWCFDGTIEQRTYYVYDTYNP